MKQWFVVHTQPSKEAVANHHLLDQGFETYLPRFKKTRRHARKVDEVLSPLFPRYLFVSLDLEQDPWRCVTGTRGVSYLLLTNDRPAAVPSQIIQNLKSQENPEGLVPLTSLSFFLKGASVRIVEGAFKDHCATFEKMDDKHRVQLLLSCLGRNLSICVPLYTVEAA
jgi:transcriptional antiterminator RfaH